MSTSWIVVIVVVAVVALVAVVTARAVWAARQRRELHEHFGAEYDRVVEQTGDERGAGSVLRDRVDEHRRLDIRPLDPAERDRYDLQWRQVQEGFVDAPDRALAEADGLVADVMRSCGYPVEDFDRRADLVSVEHPEVVRHYRAAHDVYAASRRGAGVTTEGARRALVDYRALFSELLGPTDSAAGAERR